MAPFERFARETSPAYTDAVPATVGPFTPARRRALAWAVIAYAAVFCLALVLQLGEDTRVLQEFGFQGLWLLTALGLLVGAETSRMVGRQRLGWRLLAAAWFSSLAGDALFAQFETVRWVAALSDLLYTAYYPLLIAGFLSLVSLDEEPSERLRLGLDVLIIVVASGTLAWYFVWSAPVNVGFWDRDYATGIVPLGEVLVLACAGAALHGPRRSSDRQARDLLAFGALLVCVGDLSIIVQDRNPLDFAPRQLSVVILSFGLTAFASAGLCPREPRRRTIGDVAAGMPYFAVSVVAALLLYEVAAVGVMSARLVGVAVGVIVVAALVILRLLLAERAVAAAADARLRQERRFRTLVQESNDATLVVDPTGLVRYASESCARVLGRMSSELEGQPVTVLGGPHAATLLRAAESPVGGESIRWTLPTGTGERHLESVVSDLRSAEDVGGVVLTTRDVTERIELERRLQVAQKLDALGLLAGGVAHDMNNLLMSVQVNAELLGEEASVAGTAELAEIQRATERGAALCRQLLVFGRPDAGDRKRLRLSAVVAELLPMLRRAVPTHIEVAFEDRAPRAMVEVDRSQVETALINLVVNARDAIRAEGTIRLTVRNVEATDPRFATLGLGSADHVVLTVSDTGSGMDAETRARAFEPFFTTKAAAGTGLGLAAVYGTMRALGGHIAIDSAPGRGTDAHLVFRTVAPEPGDADTPVAAPRTRAGRGRILLVDDEPPVLAALAKSLTRAGFSVTLAGDGVEALEALERDAWEVDAVLSDMSMPRMNGLTLCGRVRDRNPSMPFVLMSGYASPAVTSSGTLPPDVARLSKPFRQAELISVLNASLTRH